MKKDVMMMLSEKSKENRNKWYRDHVNKYCVCVNKNEVEYYDTVNRIIRIKNCPDTVEIGVTYKSVIGGLLNG